ncbi:hypothetical protein FM106_29650 [Brachybacterium faecium]|nr:hypothetical protein FM106_29650 [Brachybacterium faecium]
MHGGQRSLLLVRDHGDGAVRRRADGPGGPRRRRALIVCPLGPGGELRRARHRPAPASRSGPTRTDADRRGGTPAAPPSRDRSVGATSPRWGPVARCSHIPRRCWRQ